MECGRRRERELGRAPFAHESSLCNSCMLPPAPTALGDGQCYELQFTGENKRLTEARRVVQDVSPV